jgi:hypothetical protein
VAQQGTVPPTGKRMDAPCCDVFRLKDGKIQSFNCYPSGTVMLAQLGILQISTGRESTKQIRRNYDIHANRGEGLQLFR